MILKRIKISSMLFSEPVSSQQSTVIENTCSAVVKTVSINTNQL